MSSIIFTLFIFIAGAFSALFVNSHEYVKAFIVAAFGLILMLYVIRSLEGKCNEYIIKKLCYIYILVDFCFQSNAATGKMVKKVLRELALDICGVGNYSMWLKWEAYFKKNFEQIKEE